MLITSLVALAVASATPTVPKLHATVEGISEYRLANGLRVVLVPDEEKPTTTVNLTVFVGSRHEGYGEKGMAHLLEHLLFKETKNLKDIKKLLTELGGEANGTTDYDRTNYFEMFPANEANLKKALSIESDRLVNTIIKREKLAPEMTVVRNEFEMGESQPQSALMERVLSSAFHWHAYGKSVIGPKSDIELVPEERLRAFYQTYYQPDNAMLVVAGKFDVKKTLALIGQNFGKLPKPTRKLPTTYTVEPPQDGERTVTVRRTGGVPMFAAGYHVPAATDPDAPAVMLLSRVLGQMPSGRLAKDLVDTKKAAKSECYMMQQREPGFLLCIAELRASDSAAAVKEPLIAAIEGIGKKPVTAEELDRAKSETLKMFELMVNQSERVGIFLSEFAAMGDWRLFFVLRDRLKAVTVDDVNRVAQKYLLASNRTSGEYVPTETPKRVEVAAAPSDLAPLVDKLTGGEAVSAGEAFDVSPKNLDARTKLVSLPVGAKLALLPKKTRGGTVSVVLRLRVGTDQSLVGQDAAADMASKMLMRGTKTKTRAQISDAFDKMKAQVNVAGDEQGPLIVLEVRRPQLIAALTLLADVLRNPAFDEKEFELARREAIAEIEQQMQEPMALGMTEAQRLLSPWPKGHPAYVMSFAEALAETNAAKLPAARDFHARFYGAQNLYVGVVGDFDESEVVKTLTSLFGDWKAKEPYKRIVANFKTHDPRNETVATPDKPMAFFALGERMKLPDTDPDYPALMMANYLLGGGFLAGRVPQRLREKDGLSYGAGTMLRGSELADNGVFMGFAIFNPTNLAKVEAGFKEEIERALQKGFTDEELKLGKQGLSQSLQQHRSRDQMLAMTLANRAETGRKFAFDGDIEEKLAALTPAQVNAALAKHLDVKRLMFLKVGDFKTPSVVPPSAPAVTPKK